MTGRTFTRVDKRRIVVISAAGKVARVNKGFVATGGSRMTGSCSGWEKLFARVLGTGGAGAPGIDGGTIWSGSKK